MSETAIFAGGCFWGMQDLFRKLPGVLKTRAGYTGGSLLNPTYRNMDAAGDSHAEALEIIFDHTLISYRKLLEFFFQIHDPTTENRQGNDMGPHYRSAIFFLTTEQEKTAHEVITAVDASGKWPGPVKTELTKASTFYEAEDVHQDYLEKHPGGYTCHWVRPDWLLASK